MNDRRRLTLAMLATPLATGPLAARAESLREMELRYLRAAVAEPLLAQSHIEISSLEHIRIGSDRLGPHLGLRTYYGQRLKNNGVRAEISVDTPWEEGDTVRYAWRFLIPPEFAADTPGNRWWLFGNWHDQPDPRIGQTWDNFPSRSPPVAFGYGRVDNQDQLSFVYGAPNPRTIGLIPFARDRWQQIGLEVKWSRGADGRAAVHLNGKSTPVLEARGPNMHNGYRHFMKLGAYRHPDIKGDAWLYIGGVAVQRQ